MVLHNYGTSKIVLSICSPMVFRVKQKKYSRIFHFTTKPKIIAYQIKTRDTLKNCKFLILQITCLKHAWNNRKRCRPSSHFLRRIGVNLSFCIVKIQTKRNILTMISSLISNQFNSFFLQFLVIHFLVSII